MELAGGLPPVLWLVLPMAVTLTALLLGPTVMVTRAYLWWFSGAAAARCWGKSAACGLIGGMGAALVVAAFVTPDILTEVALLSLVFLLASIDWRWRWLPIEWTLAVIFLAILSAIQHGTLLTVLINMAIPGLTVLAVRQVMIWRSGQEALGLGDVWLIAGLGGFLTPFASFLMIGLAALTGLVDAGLRRLLRPRIRQTFGVSYGTHLCIVFLVVRHFGQFV